MNLRKINLNRLLKLKKNESAIKSAQKAYDTANEELTKTKGYLEDYFDTNNTEVLKATEKWYEYENAIVEAQKASKELSLENVDLKKKINMLEDVINKHKDNECQLNTLLCIQNGRVEKLRNYIKVTTGRDPLAGDEKC